MKKITNTLFFNFLLLVGCNNVTNSDSKVNYSDEKVIVLEIAQGTLKGIHRFKLEKGKKIGGVSLHYSDATVKNINQRNTFSVSANDLVSDTGLNLSYFSVSGSGKVVKGKHQAIDFEDSSKNTYCLSLNVSGENTSHGKFDSFFSQTQCQSIIIDRIGDWKEETLHKLQSVHGQISVEGNLVIRDHNGDTVETTATRMNINFSGEHRVLKTTFNNN